VPTRSAARSATRARAPATRSLHRRAATDPAASASPAPRRSSG
jgi:hypothetical protein